MTGAAALGAALVSLSCLKSVEPIGVCTQVATYNLGDVVNDSLAAGDCKQGNSALADYYQFTASGQEDIRISVTSPGLQTFLQLYDQSGVIVMNSALTAPLDTATTIRMKVAAGTWAIAVNAVSSGKTGHYTLTTVTDTAATKGCGNIWLTPGVSTTQTITNLDCTQGPSGANFYYHLYTVVLLRAQEVNFSQHSTAYAPEMVLVGPSGSTTSAPDTLGTTALLQATVVTQGAYDLWVGSANQSQFGLYTLTVR